MLSLCLFLLCFQEKDCQGCCSYHGGVVCVNGITRCGDGSALSAICGGKGCNICTGLPAPTSPIQLPRPDFLNEDYFGWDADGCLRCTFPHPNFDGMSPGAIAYSLTIRVNYSVRIEFSDLRINNDTWPTTICIPAGTLPDNFTISIRRLSASTQSEEVVISSPPRPPAVSTGAVGSLDRWLLHIPKQAGRFAAQLKLVNRHADETTSLKLYGYDTSGTLLGSESISLEPHQTMYAMIYQDVFQGKTDLISHIGIEESAQLVDISLGYRQMDSGFTVWQKGTSLTQDAVMGRLLGLETSGAADSADGVAVLNLRQDHEVSVLAGIYDKNGQKLQEKALGTIPSGGKALYVLSTVLKDPNGVSYRLWTTDNELTQAIGFSFSGPFFAATITDIIN